MRVNSYNKFFTRIAKIMKTEVKAVKVLEVRYKVELSNHVWLNVYRGASGSLFIHDHRGITDITSCYDFDDFKTMNDLYKRIITDYTTGADIIESTDLDEYQDIIENENLDETEETAPRNTIETLPPQIYNETDINPVCMKCQDENLLPYNCNKCDNKKVRKDSFDGMFGGFPSISGMYNEKCFCCPADRPGNRCCGEKWCAETWKRYEAIINPEWHHVNLSTLANLDFGMLAEKRQLYLSLYREVKELIHDLRKCKSGHTYEKRLAKMYSRNTDLVYENKVTSDYIRYVTRKVSMCNVECGFWTSANEESTGYHKSRRYNQLTMR